ncbi:hypothetical protein DRQ05_05620 [bacterium]|nr:MAG: hypothetical protein DRQ05_05620 [bacterium]
MSRPVHILQPVFVSSPIQEIFPKKSIVGNNSLHEETIFPFVIFSDGELVLHIASLYRCNSKKGK